MGKTEFKSKIISNRKVADNFYKMELEACGILFSAGQFFQVSVPGHILRRPFAPAYSDREKFSYTYQLVGEGTEKLSTLGAGTELSVIAPLGNGFTKPALGNCAILAGGGCGTPSLALLAAQLKELAIPVYAVIGARSSCSVLEEEELRSYAKKVIITTDDGSAGIKGNTVDGVKLILDEISCTDNKAAIFACGPVPMLKGIAEVAANTNIPAELSFEERMACGFGACMGCVIRINDADSEHGFVYKRVCHDGPVFNSTEIYW